MEITITMKIDNEELKDLFGLQKENQKVKVRRKSKPGPFVRVFDESCAGWSNDPVTNVMFLRCQQNYANEKLKQRGYLFLNEVYDMLGLSRTRAGQLEGWVYDPDYPTGDNYVDFGLDESWYKPLFEDRNHILLKFNVDGDILNRL